MLSLVKRTMAKIEKKVSCRISSDEFDLIVKFTDENQVITLDIQNVLGALEDAGWLDSYHCFLIIY